MEVFRKYPVGFLLTAPVGTDPQQWDMMRRSGCSCIPPNWVEQLPVQHVEVSWWLAFDVVAVWLLILLCYRLATGRWL